MERDKIKSISIRKLKISDGEHEGNPERRVTFVASSTQEDRDGDIVQIDTFRLPTKGGGHIQVSDLPATGADNIDIPFLTNHDLWNVDKTIGSVRRAYYQDGKLIFECGISSRDYAQDKLKLIEEGHLDNAFSIQYRDYYRDSDESKDLGGEIIEVSLVTRGSNKDAQVLGVKALKGKQNMNPEDSTNTEQTPETEAPKEEVQETPEQTEEVAAPEAETKEEQQAETEAPKEEVEEEKEKQIKMDTTHKEIAATQVKMPSQGARVTRSIPEDYLKSKQAMQDLQQIIINNHGASKQKITNDWIANVKSKGISGDAILPTSMMQIFFKGWVDHDEIIGTFRRTDRLVGATYAFNTDDRALGHKKGDKKADQNVTDVRRDYKSKVMYKRLPIDLQDLIDDQSGELLRFRAEELRTRSDDELGRACLVGDGRTAPTTEGAADYRIFDGTRGPWSIKGDLDEAAKTTGGSAYSKAVASVIANVTTDTTWQKIVKVKAAIKGGSGRKIIVVPEGTLTALEVATKDNGEPLFPLGTDMQNLFGAYIFESPYMTDSGYDVIGYREGSYLLAAGNMMVRSQFDMTYNQDVLMYERAVAGTLYGHQVAAGYATASKA